MALEAKPKARQLWETTTLTQVQIGNAVGRSASTIGRWASSENWGPRPGSEGKPPREPNFSSRRAEVAIASRLCSVIIKQLDLMEQGMENDSLSAEDAERKSKMIASMVGGLGKVKETPHAEKKRKRGAADAKSKAVDEVERLQREIVERFERIQRRRAAEGGTG